MAKTLKKVAVVVGVAALVVTGIGLFVAPGALGLLGGISAAANAIGLATLASVGVAGISIGTLPGPPKTIDQTGANARGSAYADPNALMPYVFGQTTVPSQLVFEQRVGDDEIANVLAHAWHEIAAYVSLHVGTGDGTELVSFSGDAATGEFAGILTWRRALGDQVFALSLPSTAWPLTAVGAGVAHSSMTWNFRDQDKLTGGVPLNLDVEVQGALLYDPRADPAYGTGSQDFDDPSSWTFNNGNAALVLLRMLIGERTPGGELIWGRGAPEAEIDMDTFVAMADVADETVDGKPRFRLGGMHLLDGDWAGFVRRWEEETGGKLSKSGGVYRLWLPHDDLIPLTTITEADLVPGGRIGHTVAEDISHLYNTARGRYIEPTEGYRALPYPEVSESAAVTDDGGKRILHQEFSWVQDRSIAERTARIKVRRSRFQRVWTVPIGWKGQGPAYRPFTVHELNVRETGNQNQLVRVIDRIRSFSGLTILICQQEDVSIYDDTLPLGDPLASDTIPTRLDRLGTLTARTIDRNAIGAGTMALRLNQTTSGTTAAGEGAIVGVGANGEPLSTADGFFYWQAVKHTVNRNAWGAGNITFTTQLAGRRGFLCYYIGSAPLPFSGNAGANVSRIAFAFKDGPDWFFDNNTATPQPFTPDATDYLAIGWLETHPSSVDNIYGGQLFVNPVTLLTATGPAGEASADVTLARIVNSALINAGFELGSLEGWQTVVSGGATIAISSADPAFGTYHLEISGGSGQVRVTNRHRLPVSQNDRVLADAPVKRVSGTGDVRVAIRWRDSSGTLVGTPATGNAVTGLVYEQSRVIGIAPSGAAIADFEFERLSGSSTVRCDGAVFGIMPRNADIDALLTTNAPAEPGADVTGNHPDDIVFYQSTAPAHVEGRIWVDSDTFEVFRSVSSVWQPISAYDALLLLNGPAEAGADVTANNTALAVVGQGTLATLNIDDITYRQSTDPGAVGAGAVWQDTDDLRLYRRNAANTAWEQIGADDALLITANAPAEAGSDVTEPRLRGGVLINPSFETGTLEGWVQVEGAWTIHTDDPVYGTYHVRSPSDQALHHLANNSRLQVEAGDRVVAQAYVQREGSGGAESRRVFVRLAWYDLAGGFISPSNGNEVTSVNYTLSRVVGVAPANAATVRCAIYSPAHVGNNQRTVVDGAYMSLVDRNSDVIYKQSGDPGAVGAGAIWVDTDDRLVYRRNTANSAWEQIAADDALLIFANAPSQGGADVTTDALRGPFTFETVITSAFDSPFYGYQNSIYGSLGSISAAQFFDGRLTLRQIVMLRWNRTASGVVSLRVVNPETAGTVPNSDRSFSSINIEGNVLNRSSASYTADDGLGASDWSWSVNTSAYPETGAVDVTVTSAGLG